MKINDIKALALDITKSITDTSWISPLLPDDKIAYTQRAIETSEKLVDEIFNKVGNQVWKDFWEYAVSYSAKSCLESVLKHKGIPLAELWKEKISWNPWFDFHSESSWSIIAFWEAKYSSSSNSYGKAIKQIKKFIANKKDIKEMSDLKHFCTNLSKDNFKKWIKWYTAAFSYFWNDYEKLMRGIMNNPHVDDLLLFNDLYLIAVEICE